MSQSPSALSFSTASAPLFSSRAVKTTVTPSLASCRHTSRPIPLFPPVTTAILLQINGNDQSSTYKIVLQHVALESRFLTRLNGDVKSYLSMHRRSNLVYGGLEMAPSMLGAPGARATRWQRRATSVAQNQIDYGREERGILVTAPVVSRSPLCCWSTVARHRSSRADITSDATPVATKARNM